MTEVIKSSEIEFGLRILAIFGFRWESDMLWLPGKKLVIKRYLRLKKKNIEESPQNIVCQHAS